MHLAIEWQLDFLYASTHTHITNDNIQSEIKKGPREYIHLDYRLAVFRLSNDMHTSNKNVSQTCLRFQSPKLQAKKKKR